MEDEVALERASQQVIKYLLDEPEFLEHWQRKVAEKLDATSQPSTSNPIIDSLRVAVEELTSTIEYVISIFESNVDPRDFYLSSENPTANREASALFEAGLKVEKLANLSIDDVENDQIANLIGSACRRVSGVVKAFGKRFQGQQSLEARQVSSPANRLCQLFYSIAHEISRFSRKSFEKQSISRKSIKSMSQSVRKWGDEWNLRVVSVVEQTLVDLEHAERKKQKQNAKKIEPIIRKVPIHHQHHTFSHHSPDYGNLDIRRRQRLATSIQDAVRRNSESSKYSETKRRTHPAGSIATSIISRRKGFLIEDSLAKARSRVPRVTHKPLNSEPRGSSEDVDEDVMKSARKVTELVMEEMRVKMRL